jgi:HPt (histidine-containing phosphotransfer) domain-containing protein
MSEILPRAALEALRARFRERSLGRLDRLAELQRQLAGAVAVTDDDALFTELRRLLHELAGGGATFGFPALGARAAELETIAKQRPDALAAALREALADMRRCLEA